LGAKAKAALDGRYTPSIDDVRYMVMPVLRHRLIRNFKAEAEGVTSKDIIERLVKEL
jgi:MoxR-like ATPase